MLRYIIGANMTCLVMFSGFKFMGILIKTAYILDDKFLSNFLLSKSCPGNTYSVSSNRGSLC